MQYSPACIVSEKYLEAGNALFQLDVFSWSTSEHFCNMEGLTQEPLDLTSTSNCQLVIFTKLIHTQNGNNILQILVILKDLLYPTSSVIVILSQNMRRKHSRCRVQWIDSRIDTKLRELFTVKESDKVEYNI